MKMTEAATSFIPIFKSNVVPYRYDIEGFELDQINKMLVKRFFIFRLENRSLSWYVRSTSFLISFFSSVVSK